MSLRPVRLVDVAAHVDLSVSTVSKALTGSREISVATRTLVREAADAMGYRPNGAARRLRSGATRTVALLTHDSVGRLSVPVLLGAEDAFGAERMSVLLCDSRGDTIRTQHHLRTLLEHGIDGIIALAEHTNDRPSLGTDIGVPVVYAYGASSDSQDFSLIPDEAHGARLAIEHLLDLGRCRIGHITGPPDYAATHRRASAAQDVLHSASLTFAGDEALLGEWTEQWGRHATEVLLRRAPDVDAIFCGNDAIARGALDTLRDAGRRVPDDVAVIGFDNWEAISTGARPPLTSVDMQLDAVGRAAAAALSQAIAGQPLSGVHHLPCSLVMRGSTVPA